MINNTSNIQLFKASPFAGLIVMTDSPRFTIVAATDNFLTVYQKKEADILKKDFFEIFGNSDIEAPNNNSTDLLALFSATIENKVPAKFEGFYVKPKKNHQYPFEAKYADVEIIPVLNESDLPVSIIVSFKATENKAISNKLDSKKSQYYSSIIENSLISFFLTKPDGTILEANKAACNLFGYSLRELRKIGRLGIIDHTDVHLHETLRERNEKGKIKTELVGIKKNGEKFPIEVSSVIFLDVNGEKRSSTTIIDITERKHVEQELILSEKKYKTFFEDNPLPMFIWDFETLNIIDCNEEALLKYGYTREEFLQLNIRDIRPKEDIALINATVERGIENGQVHKKVWRHLKKNGELIQMEVHAHLMDYHGRRVSLVLLNDVTEKMKAQTLLSESENRYKLLFYNDPIPRWVYDIEKFKILDVNIAASDHYGYSREEFLSMTIKDLQPTSEIPKLLLAHKNIKGDENIIPFGIFIHKKKNGNLIKVEVSGHLLFYNGTQCILMACNDVTEREKILQQLKDHEAKLITAQQIAKLGYWQMDIVKKSIFWSDEVYAIWGVSKDSFELSYDSFLNSIHPDDKIIFETKQKNSFIADSEPQFQHRIILPNGSIKWLQVKEKLLKNPDNNSFLLEGTVQDITTEKTLELSLQESIDRYNYVTKATSDAIWDWDIKKDIIIFGEGYKILFGHETNEVNHEINPWTKNLHPDDLDRVMNRLNSIINSNENNWKDEYRYLKQDGTYAYVIDKGFVIRDGTGKGIRMVGAMQDITQRKNEEQQKLLLVEISRLFNQPISFTETLNHVLQAIAATGNYCMAEAWMIDSDKKNMNLLAKHLIGEKTDLFYAEYPDFRNVAIGKGIPGIVAQTQTIQDWNVDEDNNFFIRKNAAIKAGIKKIVGIPFFYNETIIGSLLLGSNTLEKMQHDNIFQSRDFSLHLGAEIKRKQLEQQLNQLFDYSQDIICIADFNGYFKKINPVAFEILGYTEEELLKRPYSDFVHPDDLDITAKEVETLRKGEPSHYFENRYMTKAGKIIWFAWTATSSLEEKLIFAVAKNITDKKNLQDLLNKANRLARIGSWEIEFNNKGNDHVYWSPITKDILEVGDDYNPSITGIMELYQGESKKIKSSAVEHLVATGKEFDLELLLVNGKGKQMWIRCTGQSERLDGKCIKIFGSFQDIDERKKAAIKLAESENRFRTILEAEPECIKLLGAEGELIMMNPAGLAIIEAENEDQVIGKSMLAIILPEHRAAFSALTKNIFKGETGKLVFEIEGLKGTRRWLETNAVPMRNEQNDIISLLGVTRDITERKKAEEDIKDSEEKRRLIMSGALDAIICIDTNGNITFWNPQAEKIFGWQQKEIMGQKLSNYIIPENLRSRHDNGMNHYLKTGEANVLNSLLELSAVNKNGEIFPVELTVIPIKQEKEEFFCAFIRDITERKKAEESIRQSNERFEKVTEATNDAIWDWDIVNDNLYRGKGYNILLGYEVDKNIQAVDFWKDKFHFEDIPLVKESLQKAIEDPNATHWQQEYRIIKNSGEIATVIDRGIIIRNNTGKALRMIGAMTDITYRKEYENSLKQLNETLEQNAQQLAVTNKELEQFAYVASHDLQEPLRMVTSFLTQLENKYGDCIDDKGKQYIFYAVDGAKRMRQIILDLLEFSRIGRQENVMEQVDFNELVSDVLILLNNQIEESKAIITVETLPVISTHQIPLRQVFQNLIGNALKYRHNEKAPVIKIRCTEIPGYWMFSIKDNGIGINKEYFEKIFIIFQRLHNKDDYTGTGIGLAIVKKIINNLNGKIWVESEEGKGTTFYFTITKHMKNENTQ